MERILNYFVITNGGGYLVVASPGVADVPATPSGVTATADGASEVDVAWSSSAGASSYLVQRSADGTSGWATVGTPSGDSYADTGLSPSTSYFYRVSATNTAGTSAYSSDATATTGALTIPATPSSVVATPNGSAEIDLSWAASPGAASYTVQRSPDGSSGWETVGSAPSAAYVDTGLSASTTYFYRVSATNGAGTSAYSTVQSAITGSPSVSATPTGLSAVASGPTAIDISWAAGAGAASYTLQGSPDNSTWSTIASPTLTSYADTGLSASTTYYYRVSATNIAGMSAYSGSVTATTPAASAPLAPDGLTVAMTTTPTQLATSWTDRSDGAATGFTLQRSPDGSTWATIDTPSVPDYSFADSTLSPATAYYYRVSATGAGGTSAYTPAVSGTTLIGTAPASPTGLAAIALNSSTALLSWAAVAGATNYSVDKSPDGSTWTNVFVGSFSIAPQNSVTIGALTPAALAYFRVTAINSSGDSAPSSTISTTMPATAMIYPTAPSTFTAAAASSTSITLSWSGDSAGPAQSFSIYRSRYGISDFPEFGVAAQVIAPGGSTSIADTGLESAQTYYYFLCSVNDLGASYATATISATTFAGTPPVAPSNLIANVLGANTVSLSWNDDSATETGYIVRRSPQGAGTWTTLATLPMNSTMYADATATTATAYDYQVLASNHAGSTASATVPATTPAGTPPAAPSSLVASAPSAGQVTLSWAAGGSRDNVAIERAPDASGSAGTYAQVAEIASGATTFVDGALTPTTTYHWRVRILDLANGDSAYSNSVAATTTGQGGPFNGGTWASKADYDFLAPTNLLINAIGPTSFSIAFTGQSDAGNLSGYFLETSTDGSTDWTRYGSTVDNGSAITGLSADTVYYARVQGERFAVPASDFSNTASIETWPSSYALPAAPSGVSVTSSTPHSATLSWADNTGGTAVTIVERCDDGLNWHEVARVAPGTTTYLDNDPLLLPGSQYGYGVRCLGLGGLSLPTALRAVLNAAANADPTVALVTLPAETTVPTPPSNCAAYPGSDTKIWVAWDVNDPEPVETSFTIQLSTNGGTSWNTARASVPARWTGCYVSGLTASTSYRFRVASVSAGGTSAYSAASAAVGTLGTGQVWSPTGTIPTFGLNPEWFAGASAGLADYLTFRGYGSYAAWKEAGYPTSGGPVATGPSTWAGQVVGQLLEEALLTGSVNEKYLQFPDRAALAFQLTNDPYFASLAYLYWTTGNPSQGIAPSYSQTGLVTGGIVQEFRAATDLETEATTLYPGQIVRSAGNPTFFQSSDVGKLLQITGGAGWGAGYYRITGGPDGSGYVSLVASVGGGSSTITGGSGNVSSTTFTASGMGAFNIEVTHGQRIWWDTGDNFDLTKVGQYRALTWDQSTSTLAIVPGTPTSPSIGDQLTCVAYYGFYGNQIRDIFIELIQVVDRIYPWIVATAPPHEPNRLINFLNAMIDLELGHNVPNGTTYGLYVGDDQGFAGLFGIAMMSQTGYLGNPRAATCMSDAADHDSGNYPLPLGGSLDATGLDITTMRNAVAAYARIARGGEWVQSSEYNSDNVAFMAMALESMRTATDTEHFPEFAEILPRWGHAFFHRMSADLKAVNTWGDDENPDELFVFGVNRLIPVVGGILRHYPDIGPLLSGMSYARWIRAGSSADPGSLGSTSYCARYASYLDLRTTGVDYRSAPPAWAGRGNRQSLYLHTDWTDDTSAFYQSDCFNDSRHQHGPTLWLRRWECWFRQVRALTTRYGYSAGLLWSEEGISGLLINNVDSCLDILGLIASDFGPPGGAASCPEYAYQVASTYGYYHDPLLTTSRLTPTTLERTASVVFLPALQTGSSVTVVLYDRVQSQRLDLSQDYAQFLASHDGVTSSVRAETIPALEQCLGPMAEAPTISNGGNRMGWTVPAGTAYSAGEAGQSGYILAHSGVGGFPAHCDILLPTSYVRNVRGPSEFAAIFGYNTGIPSAENHYEFRISPNPPLPPTNLPRSSRFLQIWQAYDSGTMTNTLVQSSSGEAADGALIERTGEPDVVVLFGSKPLDRTFHSGFTVAWTSVAASTLVYIFDLDRAKAWSSDLDGDGAVGLVPTDAGVGRVAVAGVGLHTLIIAGS